MKVQYDKKKAYAECKNFADTLNWRLAHKVTAIVGLREALIGQNRIFRWVWAFMFCFGVGMTGFYLYSTTQHYLSFPTSTSVR